METLPFEQVEAIRKRFGQAREIAASRFRDSFARQTDLPPNERWRAHLEIQAASMLDVMEGVSLPPELRVCYLIEDRLIHPIVIAADVAAPSIHDRAKLEPSVSLFPFFRIERTVAALFEYWVFTSELLASSSWPMTRILASSEEYNAALAGMKQPQLVRPLFVSYLPSGEFREDGTAMLEVTLYTRATEERIERRELLLNRQQEFHFHGRELIAEGRAGVQVLT